MKLTKYTAIRFIDIIKTSEKEVFTCEDLAYESGIEYGNIVDYIEEFYSMIRIDPSYNLRNLVVDFESYVDYLTKHNLQVLENEEDKPEEEYENFMDYINKHMTINGKLDVNHVLTEKDKKILRKLLYKPNKK